MSPPSVNFDGPVPFEPPPLDFTPMSPLDGPPPEPGDHRWVYCAEVPGHRVVVHVNGALTGIGRPAVRVVSTIGRDVGRLFPELDALQHVNAAGPFSIDGVLRAVDLTRGSSELSFRFAATDRHDAEQRAKAVPVQLVVRDLMHLDGRRVADQPYAARRYLLRAHLRDEASWVIPPDHLDPAPALLEGQALPTRVPHLLSRRLDSRYFPGTATGTWIRTAYSTLRLTDVVGWIDDRPRVGTPHFDALMIAGLNRSNGQRPVQLVRHGLTMTIRAQLAEAIAQLPTTRTPERLTFTGSLPRDAVARWARPGVRATVIGSSLDGDRLLEDPVVLDLSVPL